MSGYTDHYGLEMLDGGDSFSVDGQKYTLADRAQMDRLLYAGAEGHVHNGAAGGSENPSVAGTLAVVDTGGSIAAGTTLWYEYTLVDPSGAETLPSPPVSVTLADGLVAPSAPTVAATVGTGTLPAGDYFYALSAYTGVNTNETLAPASGYVFLPALGECTITFPSLPSGADGFNLYRKGSSELNFMYLDSSAGTSPYVDDGTVTVSCTRSLPTASSAAGTNSVTFTLPSALPTGFTWNLYQTTQLGQWTGSLIANVIETVSDEDLDIVTSYTDTGAGYLDGSPPLSNQIIGSPSQIDLTADVTGLLPMANVASFPLVITFAFPGSLTPQTGTSVWTNEFPSATIVSVRASLARGSYPQVTPVEVDVVLGTGGATPTYTSIFPTGPLPEVAVAAQIGTAQAPPSTITMNPGDSFGVDLIQAGGGATPTDHDLTVNIYLLVTEE